MTRGDRTIVAIVLPATLAGTTAAGVDRLAEFERLRQINLARGPEIVAVKANCRAVTLTVRAPIFRDRDINHTAPR